MRALVLLLSVSLCRGETPLGSALQTNDTLDTVFSEYFQWKLKTYPEWATLEGLGDYNNLVEDFSMEAIRAKADMCKQFLERSRKLEAENTVTQSYQNYFEVKIFRIA